MEEHVIKKGRKEIFFQNIYLSIILLIYFRNSIVNMNGSRCWYSAKMTATGNRRENLSLIQPCKENFRLSTRHRTRRRGRISWKPTRNNSPQWKSLRLPTDTNAFAHLTRGIAIRSLRRYSDRKRGKNAIIF